MGACVGSGVVDRVVWGMKEDFTGNPGELPAPETLIEADKPHKGRKRGRGQPPKEFAGVLKAEWDKRIMDEEFLMCTDGEKARVMGVSLRMIAIWKKATDWEKVAAEYRKGYSKFKPMIDMALIRKAMRGSEKAMEMFYQKYEGWFAKSGIDINVTREYEGLDNRALVGELLKMLPEDEKKALLTNGEVKQEIVVNGEDHGALEAVNDSIPGKGT